MNSVWTPYNPVFTVWELWQSMFGAEYLASVYGELYGDSITAMCQ